MINASTQLKEESLTNRNYYVTANVTLSDGTTLKLEKKDFFFIWKQSCRFSRLWGLPSGRGNRKNSKPVISE